MLPWIGSKISSFVFEDELNLFTNFVCAKWNFIGKLFTIDQKKIIKASLIWDVKFDT